MSKEQEDISSQPLVIVRRRRAAEDSHHGGVWKIAYADFMTAMMAFFLVMWLINAADKKTIVQVAAYFNPMRLTDKFASPKGLDDATETENKETEKKDKKGTEKQSADKKIEAEHKTKDGAGEAQDEEAKKISASTGGKSSEVLKEQALFDNPGEMLEKLATQARASQPTTAAAPIDGNLSDPFDRINRKSGRAQTALKPADPTVPAPKIKAAEPSKPTAGEQKDAQPPAKFVQGKSADNKSGDAKVDAEPRTGDAKNGVAKQAVENPTAKPEVAAATEAAKAERKAAEEAKTLQSEISKSIAQVSKILPQVEVKATPEGLLISLLDDANFGMFEVGSAKPRPELVLVMEKVGNVLKEKPGNIVVRGHTDSRAYRSGVYDNWRLSAARAQMAYYMLVRSGVPESNFVAIEGRADRDPKIPTDTEAAPNRRIDILIKGTHP